MEITMGNCKARMQRAGTEQFRHAHRVHSSAHSKKGCFPFRKQPLQNLVKCFLHIYLFLEAIVYEKPKARDSLNCNILRPLGYFFRVLSVLTSTLSSYMRFVVTVNEKYLAIFQSNLLSQFTRMFCGLSR